MIVVAVVVDVVSAADVSDAVIVAALITPCLR